MSRLRRFYCSVGPQAGRIELVGQEARHALRVMRLRPGDEALLFDGSGSEYTARLVQGDRRRAVFDVLSEQRREREWPVRIAVASAVPKGRRADFMVEKLCELGASEWIPLQCERTAGDRLDRWDRQAERWKRIAVEASKQCGRNRVMDIRAPVSWDGLLAASRRYGTRWICLPDEEGADACLSSACGRKALIAVGPEGGFSDAEEEAALAEGFRPLSLAPAVLRVETAAIASLVRLTGFFAVINAP